jgi:hypothetical protein
MSEHILSALAHLANAKRLFEQVRDNERVSSKRRYYAAVRLDDVAERIAECEAILREHGK